MFTGKDFIITNFEGVYSLAVSERRLKRSPLRDVASMLWSLHFAAHNGLSKYHNMGITVDKELEFYAQQWWFCMSRNFLKAYFSSIKGAGFIPSDKENVEYLIMFYLLDKTLVELNNILFQSPEMLNIPLDLIKYLTDRIENK
jgi:maltose alpha-D-glucosyltransferase/alpha-amylase